MQWRLEAKTSDIVAVARIAADTGYFRPDEVAVAVELVETALRQGPAAGYEFVFAERGDQLVGYCAYGQIACTLGSYEDRKSVV